MEPHTWVKSKSAGPTQRHCEICYRGPNHPNHKVPEESSSKG